MDTDSGAGDGLVNTGQAPIQKSKELSSELAAIIRKLEKTHGAEVWSLEPGQMACIPTGLPALDAAIGQPGLPYGKIIQFYGRESCGKSLLALTITATAIRSGRRVVYLDFENSLDADYLRTLGIVTPNPNFFAYRPDSMESGFDIMAQFCAGDAVDLVVFDSVGAMSPKSTLEKETGEAKVGGKSLALSVCLQQMMPDLINHNVTVIFVNQIRAQINTGWAHGSNETVAGGNALKYLLHVNVRMWRNGLLKDSDGTPIGMEIGLKVEKNKVGPPFGTALLTMYFGKGIDIVASIANFALDSGLVLMGAQGWIRSDEYGVSVRGKPAFVELLKGDTVLLRSLLTVMLSGKSAVHKPMVDNSEIVDS